MSPLLRTVAVAAAGFVAAAIYREWQTSTTRRKRLPIERWENEGGAVPEPASSFLDADSSPEERLR